jgi:hypothetical protein
MIAVAAHPAPPKPAPVRIQLDSVPEVERRILLAYLAVAKAPTATQAQAGRVAS